MSGLSFHTTKALGPYVFFDIVNGQELRGKNSGASSFYNEFEADAAVELLSFFKQSNTDRFIFLCDAKSASLELLNEVMPSVFYVMQNCEIDTAFSIVQFLSAYVATMKSLSPLRETQLRHVGQILEVIRMQIQFDPVYRGNLDALDKIGKEEEDRMMEFRKDLTGMEKMCALGEELEIPFKVYGPEATMTGICKQAIECVMAAA